MCKTPQVVYNENGMQEVACRNCWQCLDARVKDWMGRNVAESKTAKACSVVTLTYGRDENGNADHPRATVLTYSDVQKFLKRLRVEGYPVRYFIVGEFGSLNGRAHWHCILYWQDRVPAHETELNFSATHRNELGKVYDHPIGTWWPHGFLYWRDGANHAAVAYACIYLNKEMGGQERQFVMRMSKKPLLGAAYLRHRAEEYVAQGLIPQTLEYSWPDVTNRAGKVIKFWLRDKAAELFLGHYVDKWRETYPGEHMPSSELVEEFLDKGANWTVPFEVPDPDRHTPSGFWLYGDETDWLYRYAKENGLSEQEIAREQERLATEYWEREEQTRQRRLAREQAQWEAAKLKAPCPGP